MLGSLSANGATTGTGNIFIGYATGNSFTTGSNIVCIGSQHIFGAGASNQCFIWQIRGVTTGQNNAVAVLVDSADQLGTVSSKREMKENIKDTNLEETDKLIRSFQTYRYNMKVHTPEKQQWGMMVEDLVEGCPDLVAHDKDGNPEAIMWQYIPYMLIAHNQYLTKRIDALEAKLAKLI